MWDEIIDVTPEKITVKKSLEEEEQILTSTMPCVLTTLSGNEQSSLHEL